MSVYSLIVKILGQDAGASASIKSVSGAVSNLDKQAQALADPLKMLGIAGIGFLGKQAISAVVDLGKMGAGLLRIQAAFNSAAASIGADADQIRASMAAAADGLVDDDVTISEATKLMASGVKISAEDMATVLELARLKAHQFGMSTEEAFLQIAQSAEKGAVRGLRGLGIFVENAEALEGLADATGRETDAVSSAERAQATWNAVLETGRAQLQQFGTGGEDAKNKIERMDTAIGEAKDALAMALAPAMAAVSGAIAEAVPRLVATTQQLQIPARAGVEWAQAALSGQNATVAFNASIADSVGATEQAAQIRASAASQEYQAAMQVVSGLQAAIAAEQAYLATQEEGTMAYEMSKQSLAQLGGELEQATGKMQELGGAVQRTHPELYSAASAAQALGGSAQAAASGVGVLATQFQALTPAARVAAAMMDDVAVAIAGVQADLGKVSAEEIGQGFAAAAGQIEGSLLGLVGKVDTGELSGMYDQYLSEIQAVYQNAGDITDFELKMRVEAVRARLGQTVDALNQGADQEKGALDRMQQQYSSLRSAVTAALQGTTVTAEDMGLAGIGEYVEKWDENARRLDAIAQRGFAELQQHADWASVLKIPPEVMAAGEEALKAWASRTAGAVRDLTRPDLINLDAAVAAVEQYQREQAAKEITIDLVIAKIAAKGGLSEEEARKQVLATYGLEEALPVSLQLAAGAKEALVTTVGTISIPTTLAMTTTETTVTAPAVGAAGVTGVEEEAKTLPVSLVPTEGWLETLMATIGIIAVPITLSFGSEGAKSEEQNAASAVAPIIRALVYGFKDGLELFSPVQVVAERVSEDVSDNAKVLLEAGQAIWDATEAGLVKGIKRGDYADVFAATLVPIIIKAIKDWGKYK